MDIPKKYNPKESSMKYVGAAQSAQFDSSRRERIPGYDNKEI